MKVKYDENADVLYFRLSNLPVKESDEDKPGIIIDYAEDNSIVGIEILDASKKNLQYDRVEYEKV